MSGHAKKKPGYTMDKFLMEKAKPAYFGFVYFLKKIAILAILFGLLGYILSQFKANDIDLIRIIFHGESLAPIQRK